MKVKRNQKNLFTEIESIITTKSVVTSNKQEEFNRGRLEKRLTYVYKPSKKLKEVWTGVRAVVFIKRTRVVRNKRTNTLSYYISSLNQSARQFSKGIRHHWGIENRLHYVKDVSFKEDYSKIKLGEAPGILSLIRNLVINVARINGENRIKKFIRQCNGDIDKIIEYLE